MSGIIGYIGRQKASIILSDGLKRLEYRGYDSAGIAVLHEGQIAIRKTEGRVEALMRLLMQEPVTGNVGIGHTRWATHGSPSTANAHPLTDCQGRLAIVHNGIIENDRPLKRKLQERGHKFLTDTDTEVIAHLLEEYKQERLLDTVLGILPLLKGTYAMAILSQSEPDTIVAVRKDNPLVVGYGQGEYFLASDAHALAGYAQEYYPLRNEQIAVLKPEGITLYSFEGEVLEAPNRRPIPFGEENPFVTEHPHYMLKEILEQPRALHNTIKHRLKEDRVELPELQIPREAISKIRRIIMVACGTSHHAVLVGRKMLEQLCGLSVYTAIASEFRYDTPKLNPEEDLFIVVSQSGETADALAALREVLKSDVWTIAITNTHSSSIAREAHDVLYTHAGPELAVASTKTYTAAITTILLLALWLAEKRGAPAEELAPILEALRKLPEDVSSTLIMTREAIDQYASVTYDTDHLFLIGRGLDRPVALEGSLKLQEIAYIHSDAYAAGELKHGTLALITPGSPVIVLATHEDTYHATVGNIKELKARDAFVMAITTVREDNLADVVDEVLYIPSTHPLLMPVLSVIPLQLLAYYTGVMRGNDVDRPRNLAKSVTVE